jgi:hypothetical protein
MYRPRSHRHLLHRGEQTSSSCNVASCGDRPVRPGQRGPADQRPPQPYAAGIAATTCCERTCVRATLWGRYERCSGRQPRVHLHARRADFGRYLRVEHRDGRVDNHARPERAAARVLRRQPDSGAHRGWRLSGLRAGTPSPARGARAAAATHGCRDRRQGCAAGVRPRRSRNLQITVTPTERGLIGLTLVDPGQVRHVQALPSQAVSPNAASASGWPRRARRRLGRPISCAISSAGMIWRRAIRERTSRSGPRAAVGAGLVQAAPERPDGRRKLSASRRPDVPGRSSERRNGRSAPCGSTGAVCRTGAWPFRLYRPGSDGSRRLERVARASVRRDGEYG